jgi:hypothetical protein
MSVELNALLVMPRSSMDGCATPMSTGVEVENEELEPSSWNLVSSTMTLFTVVLFPSFHSSNSDKKKRLGASRGRNP